MATKPNIVRGGKAINIGKRLYYIDGKPHELGGVDIGRNLEVEGGEVVEVKNKGLRVYSAQPILNGNSPAELVMNGIEPNTVFNAQEKFKDINKLNDDGTKKKSMGGLSRSKDYGSKKKPYPNVDKKDFAGGGRSYPIPTKADAIDALRLAGLHGRSDVKAKVYRKYPELKKRVGGTVSINGNVIDKLLFASSSTGDKKKALLGTNDKRQRYINIDDELIPIYNVPTPLDYVLSAKNDLMPSIGTNPNTTVAPKINKIEPTIITPYQWDDTQFNITPGSISKAETNRSLRGPLGDNGGYDPIEEGILQIKEVGTGKSGTPNNFTWRNYTDPSSDESIVNRVPRSINAEEELNKWGFNPNRIYVRNNNQGNQTEIEQTNSSSNSSVTMPRRGYSKSTSSRAVTPRTMKTTVNERPIGISVSPSVTLPVPNISQKAINDTVNNGLKTQSDLYRGSFDDITTEDWIGAGGNLAASVASYFTGLRRPSIDLVRPSKPIMEQAVRFVTKYNNRPEVSNIRENIRRSIDDISANTSSSRAALQRMQRVRNAGTRSINESEARKQNIETQLKNADAANRQAVRARNVTRYNNWLDDLQNVRNKQRIINAERSTGKLQNTIGLFNNVNATLQDLLSRIEQRRKFNNTLSYLQSTAPNVDDRIMRDNGVNFDYLRTVGG